MCKVACDILSLCSQTTDMNKSFMEVQCPEVVEVCQTCWKRGQKSFQQPGKDKCQRDHSNWSCNIVFLLKPSLKELRPLPRTIPRGLNFIICKYISEGKKCAYTGTGPCQYAHSQDELEAWKYMCLNGSE